MATPREWRIIRVALMPAGAIAGFLCAQALLMPDPNQWRRAGEIVDGTGYGSAALIAFLGGIVVAYIVRSVLDFVLGAEGADDS